MTATRTLAAALTERQHYQTVPEPQLTQSALALTLTATLALALCPLDSSRVDSTLDSDYVLCLGERDLGFPSPLSLPLSLCYYFLFFILLCSILFCHSASFSLGVCVCVSRFVTAFCLTWPKCLIPYNVV